MMTRKKYKFDVDVSSIRLDVFLTNKLPDFSRTSIQHSIKSNLVTINNKLAKRSTKINDMWRMAGSTVPLLWYI